METTKSNISTSLMPGESSTSQVGAGNSLTLTSTGSTSTSNSSSSATASPQPLHIIQPPIRSAPTTTSVATNGQNSSSMISIKVRFVDSNITKTLQFNPQTLVYDALKIIREKIPETSSTNASNYGIFISNSDASKGTWLENGRTLDYYMLKNGDTVDYCNKYRKLSIRLLDGQSKTLLVDDSQTVGQLMIFICSQMGIANYEEYSLINDVPESEKERTLKRDKATLPRDFKKLEVMKRKLHTDDDIAWLDHSKTLRQQSIDQNSVLILKRKFFFSDKNIDTRDPVQLNLLYVQCRDAILNGTHPINEEMAVKLAALQCQIKYGDYNEQTTRSGSLDLKEYLPKEYVKVKGIEKKIFQEYKTSLVGLNELESKHKYTQLCRSLKTYGVTFFLVKEKMKGKNKLVARLLGIAKDSIIRVDEKSKEFLDVYPLERVKKWAASPNTFTLDFGDHYKEQYYSMQTTEGEHIARLISGYIDIILKTKKGKEYNGGVEVDEESPMLEEVVAPSKATVIQMNKTNVNQSVTGNVVLPGLLRNGQESSSSSFMGGGVTPQPQAAQTQNSNVVRQVQVGYSVDISNTSNQMEYQIQKAKRPLITTIENARHMISRAQNNLQQRPTAPVDIGNDPASIQWKVNMIDVNRQNVTSHLSAMNASTAQVVTLTSQGPQNSDFNAVGAAVSCISTNLGDFSKDVMMIAALQQQPDQQQQQQPESEYLLDAARKLCLAFSDFLRYVEPDCSEPRQNLFSAVGKIGEAGNEVIRNINRSAGEAGSLSDSHEPKLQERIIGFAKAVASSTAGLVIASKNVANHCENQQGVNEVISMVTQCAMSTSQLVSCAKVCSSTIHSKQCQEQIVEAARQVSGHVDAVMDCATQHCRNELALAELRNCAAHVTDSVSELLENVRASDESLVNNHFQSGRNSRGVSYNGGLLEKHDESIEKIFQVTDNLSNIMHEPSEIIKQAKFLALATTDLINALRQEAHSQPTTDMQKKLLLAAKLLAEAISKIVEAAKGYATNPDDETAQSNLKRAAEDLKTATSIAAGNNLQLKLIKRLELCAKQAASCATQSIAAIQVCTVQVPTPPLATVDEFQENGVGPSSRASSSLSASVASSNNQTHNQLIQQCKIVADHVPKIVQGIRGCMVSLNSKSAHLGLINACEDFILPAQKMVALSKAVLPTIVDEIKAIQLRNCTNQLTSALNDLKTCLARAQEVCGSFESDAMIDSIKLLDKELIEIKQAAASSTLKPLPGETLEVCEAQLAAVSKTVGLSMAQMLTAAAQGNDVYTGIAAKETFNSLRSFTSSIRAIAACSANNAQYQEKLIESARIVLEKSISLVNEAKLALMRPQEQSQNQQRLTQIARSIAQSLYECVNCLPGQKDIDEVIKSIGEFSAVLFSSNGIRTSTTLNGSNGSASKSESPPKQLTQIQRDLNESALQLNQATNQIVIDSRKGSQHLSQSTYRFSGAFGDFLQHSLTLAGQEQVDEEVREQIVRTLRDVYTNSTKLLQSAKSCIADPNASTSRQQLAIAVKQVTESINSVVNLCLETNNPVLQAQKECDNALRDIETTRTIVQANHLESTPNGDENNSDEPFLIISEPPTINTNLNSASGLNSYYDCLDQIIELSRLLGESMTGLANSCKPPVQPGQFVTAMRDTSASVCALVEAAAHSAYIIGVSDIESKRGRPSILDSSHFINCSQRIQDTCGQLQTMLTNSPGGEGIRLNADSQRQLISAATQIAHQTANLCNASQQASSRTTNILAKRHFVQSAKQVANATAHFVKTIKSLDAESSDPSQSWFRQETYNSLVKPLLESVESLCQYALSPEFASIAAQISTTGARSQQPILHATRHMLDAAAALIQASRSLIANNKDPKLWQSFSTNSKIISDSIIRLAKSIKEKAPAKAECDHVLASIEKCTRHLESALVAVRMNQPLQLSEIAEAKSLQTYEEHAINCAQQVMELVDQVRVAAKGEADKLGHLVTEIGQYFEPLVVNVIGCAAKTKFDTQQQTLVLEQTKTVLESAAQFMVASKESAGNPKNTSNLHQTIDENADGTKEVLDDLIQTLEEATAQHGYVTSMVDHINRAMANVEINGNGQPVPNDNHKSNGDERQEKQLLFVEYQTKIVQLVKLMQENIKSMSICQRSELGPCAQQLTTTFNYLIMACKGAIQACVNNIDLQQRIRLTTADLGKSCIELVHLAGRLQQQQNGGDDKMLRKEFLEQTDVVTKRVMNLLNSLKTSARGTQACISAENAVNGIIADLNTVIMFASAGTLKAESDGDIFSNHRELILRSAKTLVEDTKSLVSVSGRGSAQQQIEQDELAECVETSVRTITRLSDAVKLGSASLGSDQPEAQVLLINSVKDVAAALSDLINTIKIVASGSLVSGENPSAYSGSLLSESAKVMITNIQSLLKTVKTVEDEAQRGTRALESAIDAIHQEIRIMHSAMSNDAAIKIVAADAQQQHMHQFSPDDLIKATKQITMATSKAIGAANSMRQEDIIVAANMGRKAVSDLLFVCHGAMIKLARERPASGEDGNHSQQIMNAGLVCANHYNDLLECIQAIFNKISGPDSKQKLISYSKNVASSVSEILQLAEVLKGNDWVDPEDPTVIAENELLGAASAIESAAKKLSVLKPRTKTEAVNENLNFDEQILEAAKSITNAAGALIKAATAAQKELVSQGKLKPINSSSSFEEDGQWSQGLISAARMVAAACHALCEAANGLVQGHGTEERLISSAKQVASSTAALLVACKVKSDLTSQAMKRLQHAGNAIKRATDALVRSAQQAVDANEEDQYLELNTRFVGSMAQEIMLREEIIRKEKELKAAQAAYNAVKKARYKREEEGSPAASSSSSASTSGAQPATTVTNATGLGNGHVKELASSYSSLNNGGGGAGVNGN